MSLIKKGGTKHLTRPANPPDPQQGVPQQAGSDAAAPPAQPPAPEEGTRNLPAKEQPAEDATQQVQRPSGNTTRSVQMPPSGNTTRSVQMPPSGNTTRSVQVPPAENNRPAPAKQDDVDEESKSRRKASYAQTLKKDTLLQNRYQIESVLGIGGMSVVYVGRDTRLRFNNEMRVCAIKEMYQSAPDTQTRALNLRMFEREAGLLATLSHPAIPKVYDFFEEGGRVYLVMEMIHGKDLDQVLQESGKPVSEARVGNWAMQVCDVMDYLHNHNPEIVFRDMKPSNVLVTPEERIVLIDFGIARTLERGSSKGTMIGTEGYAPPEQYRGMAEPQGDIYALGATLHHLLTNDDPRMQTPFTFHERPIRSLNSAVSPEMEAVVVKALEYDIGGRWQSAREMKQAMLSVPSVAAAVGIKPVAATILPAVQNWNTTTTVAWTFTCEDEVRSSPRVSDGMLLIGCYDTNLYALDLDRGEFRWKYATEGGVAATPDVWEDVVIIGSEDSGVYGIDLRTGKLRWVFRAEKAIRSSPRVYQRVVFVGSDDLHLYAIDGTRGTQMWKARFWMPIRSTSHVEEDSLYVGGVDGSVYCLDPRNGGTRWKQKTQQPVISSPTVSDGLVFVGSSDNNLYALDAQGGWPAWKFRTGHAVNSSPCVVGTRVFVGSADGNMYAVEKKNGRLAWKFETGSQITSSPRHYNGRIYFGAIDGHIYALDAGSGELAWKHKTNGPVVSSAAFHNDIVYIGSMDYKVYALKA
ncbi:MAG: PQQ-binding-like beta-propeller repeat protein [Chloroflexaceae bacterium]|nr:PQQ-binding-like beta-propeller repeat protein [Chloroflexaceae bacterium]